MLRLAALTPLALAALFTACGADPEGARSAADVPPVASAPPPVDRPGDALVEVAPKNVELVVSMPPLRNHPVGRRIVAMLAAAPEVRDALAGSGLDPLRDVDWAYGAATSTKRDAQGALVVHLAMDDDKVDGAFDALTRRSPTTAPLDLGTKSVSGVRVSLAHADRVVLRAHPSLVLVVAPEQAQATATTLAASHVLSPVSGDEAMRATLVDPHASIDQVPAAITRGRAWIVAGADGGAELFGEGECADAGAASAAAGELVALVRKYNVFLIRLATHGLLDGADIHADGATVKVHLPATREQLEATLNLAAAGLGVDLPPAGK